MLAYNYSDTPEKIGIVLTPGFEEETAVYCATKLRDAGLPVSIIGMSGQSVKGLHGISVKPDITIDEINREQTYRLIIISGGRQYITSSMLDPRVYDLLQRTIQSNGFIVPIARTTQFLVDAGFPDENKASYIISNNGKSLKKFAEELITLASIELMQPDFLL